MIERVARAICQMHGSYPDDLHGDGLREWQHWIDEAHAAIQAMRKPTEEMVIAASEVVPLPGPSNHRHRKRRYWKAMIDKALEDG